MTPSGGKEDQPRSLFGVGMAFYQQVVALIAAFALIAFFSHFFDFEWRGFMLKLVGQWNEYVRPATKWLLNLFVTLPLGWLGWNVEVPLLVRDYLAVGLISAMSYLRRFLHMMPRGMKFAALKLMFVPWHEIHRINRTAAIGNWPPLVVLFWPAVVFLWILSLPIVLLAGRRRSFVGSVLILAPLFYFGLLFAMNQLLL